MFGDRVSRNPLTESLRGLTESLRLPRSLQTTSAHRSIAAFPSHKGVFMRTKWLILPVLLALVLPASASAMPDRDGAGKHTFELGEKLVLVGKGRMRGSVHAPDHRILFKGRAGVLKVVNVAGDAIVRCRGRGHRVVRENDRGQEVTICKGVKGHAVVTGSGFRFGLFAHRMKAIFPAGISGQVTVHGRFWHPSDVRSDLAEDVVDVAPDVVTDVVSEETADAAAEQVEATV